MFLLFGCIKIFIVSVMFCFAEKNEKQTRFQFLSHQLVTASWMFII